MKRKNVTTEREEELFQAILQLQSVEECRNFFYDLCTTAEIEEFADRWCVAQMLMREIPYRKISEETGVSTTTIGRVARFLNNGNDGYMAILKRIGG